VTAIQSESVAATLKHFPGHGDTMTDSHLGLPLVEHTLAEAWAIDLYPFKAIIEKNAPDLIMTAHIQYPALDDSLIEASKAGKKIIAPATLSRKIQYDLLRKQLNYAGVVITDALDMGAIAENFDSVDATIKAFQAGDDIALMPVAMTEPADIDKISALISKIVAAVSTGEISQKELDASVLRILKLKIKLGLLKPDQTPLADKISNATATLSDENQHKLESAVTDAAVTLVQNKTDLLPIKLLPGARIHILTPWLEQGAGIAVEIRRLQAEHLLPSVLQISFAKMADTNLITEKLAIDNADIIIVGDSATKSLPLSDSKNLQLLAKPTAPSGTLVFPDMLKGDSENSCNASLILRANSNLSDAQFAYEALLYAKDHGKKTIFMSLLAPYDLPNYKDAADVMLAGYDWYGYLTDSNNHGFYRGPSMPALTRILFGISKAQGRLPIQIPNPNNLNEIVYPRGYGM
jgi:beta-N-acetylhexosaminidase